MSGEQGWGGTKRFSRGCNAQSLPPLPSTSSIIQNTLPFLRRFNGQRLGPAHPYFIRLQVKTDIPVAETSASIGPKTGSPCGCSLLSFFSKLIDVFDSQCPVLVCPFAFGGLFLILSGETENSPPVVFFRFFIQVILIRKSDHLPPPFITSRANTLEIIVTIFAIFDSLDDSPSDWTSLRQSGTWRCSEPMEK